MGKDGIGDRTDRKIHFILNILFVYNFLLVIAERREGKIKDVFYSNFEEYRASL